MKKVFITGVAGFLGSHLAKNVRFRLGCVCNDNFLGSDNLNLHSFVDFFETDCCDLASMSNAMKGADLLFHCAATHTRASLYSPQLS